MSEVILGHRLTKNTNGKTVFMVFHPNENTVEVDALYDYVINAGYPVLTNALIAEWSLKGLTTNEIKDIGWACETSAPTGTFSPTEDATLNGAATGALNLQVKYKIMNYNPANVTADMNDLSLNSTISFYMAMA